MRTASLGACMFLVASLTSALLPAGEKASAVRKPAPILLLPGEKSSVRLRLDIIENGKSPEAAWESFLDRLFDHFDADNDRSLSRRESSRIMPLPLPGGKELVIDFDRLDANNDGKGSRAELKAFCRGNGFTPIVVVVAPPSAADLGFANLFSRWLDINGDGTLTRDVLRRAPEALRKYDINDDEYLDLSELVAGIEPVARPRTARLKVDHKGDENDTLLRVDLGAKAGAVLAGKRDEIIKLAHVTKQQGLYRLHAATDWWLTFRAVHATADIGSARDFLLAQFKSALGDAATLSTTELKDDAALAGILELLPYADRNGDGKLSLAELRAYLDLVELGMRAQVWVTATDHDRNPFDFLDRDGDGRLSYREQISAPDLLGGKTAMKGLPSQFNLSFGGPAVKSWGGVAIPAVKQRAVRAVDLSGAPPWFRAMDRNRDGVISTRDFVGSPELFRKLDVDGDGVISSEEAESPLAPGRRLSTPRRR